MYDLINDVFNEFDRLACNTVKASVCSSNGFPFSDIYLDEKESYVIEIGLAGYSEKDISVEYKDSWIYVTGKAPTRDDKKRQYLKTGLKFPSEFTVKFGVDINKYDVNKCNVNMSNGILQIVIPTKKDFIKSKTFLINAN